MILADQIVHEDGYSRQESAFLYEEAKKFFPGGVNSPVRAFKSVVGPPVFMKKGEGARIIDEDNNHYLDFCGSWGPLILGHADPDVTFAIIEAVKNGASFGTPTRLGMDLGKFVTETNPYLEMMRFVSSGTEAVMSAIRLARGYTGKSKILKFEGCYHGHVDSLLVKAGSGLVTFGESSSAGVTEALANQTIVIPLNNLEALEQSFQQHHQDLACVIIEPVPANNGLLLQDKSFLVKLRELCTEYKVLLIFDEVISGYRVGFHGASGYYDISPDLLTYGKIIGGGMPVGAYGGKKEYMKLISPDGPVYQAGTLSGNPVAMAAGLATLHKIAKPGFYENLEEKTQYFTKNILDHIHKKSYEVSIPSIGSIFWVAFSTQKIQASDQIDPASMEKFKVFHFELLKNGIYFGPSGYEVGFVSAAHSYDDLDKASDKICKCLDKVFNS